MRTEIPNSPDEWAAEQAKTHAVMHNVWARWDAGIALQRKDGERVFVRSGAVEVTGEAFDYTVMVEAVREPGPHAEVRELTVRARPGGPAVSASRLRREPVGTACRLAVEQSIYRLADDGMVLGERPVDGPADAVAAMHRPVRRARKGEPAMVVQVAEAYRDARRAGAVSVHRYIASRLKISPATSRQYVHQARAAELLPLAGGSTRPRD